MRNLVVVALVLVAANLVPTSAFADDVTVEISGGDDDDDAVANPGTLTINIAYYSPFATPANETLKRVWDRFGKGRKVSWTPIDEKRQYARLPAIALGEIQKMQVELDVYRLPSAPEATSVRLLLLKTMDAVIFVADAKDVKGSKKSLAELEKHLKSLDGRGPSFVVFQYENLTDEAGADALEKALGVGDRPGFITNHKTGHEILEPLKAVTKLVVSAVVKRRDAAAKSPTAPAAAGSRR